MSPPCCCLAPVAARTQPVETEIPDVTAEVVELRTSGGVTAARVRYANGGAKEAESNRFAVGKIVLVDVKSKKKHFPIKDANGQFVGGPIGDSIDGGRISSRSRPASQAVLWAYFERSRPRAAS